MQSQGSGHTHDADARAHVQRPLAVGVPADRISVVVGQMSADYRDEPLGRVRARRARSVRSPAMPDQLRMRW